MHYTVDYGNITDEVTKHNQAIKDIVDYMGQKKFDDFTEKFRKERLALEPFTFYLLLMGVEGYPVKAWYNYCYPL